MNYCKICCQPDSRPKLVMKDGICGACLWELEEKPKVDWGKREVQLHEIAENAKFEAKKRGTHDCVIGVSGGKDSIFQALYARDKLGLNPLLVSAFPDEITPEGIHNFNNLVSQGFDCLRIHVNPKLLATLMRDDFLKYCHFRKATEYPLWASVYTIAKEKNIPLIIQGENAALTLGVSEDMNTDWDASTIYKTNTIAGATASEHYPHIDPKYLILYNFPDLSNWEGKAIWLNYFVKEWSPTHNAYFAIDRGLQVRTDTREALGRIHPWTCLDSNFHQVSQMHKYYKFGFGFTTDEVCYDIRQGLLTRDEGFELIKKYDGLCDPKYVKQFCDFVGITENDHWDIVAFFKKYDPWNRWEAMSGNRT